MSNTVDRNSMVRMLSLLGESMVLWGKKRPKSEFHPFIADPFYDRMESLIQGEKHYNGWFTEEAIRESLWRLGDQLTEENLTAWLANYPNAGSTKRVGLILAGNIPLVGFHDFISVLLSGHRPIIKLSSDDRRLLPLLIEVAETLQPDLKERVETVDRLSGIDAVIATGSDNSARYFEKYFGHLPNIIRKNRTSIAVIKGDESEEDLKELGRDIFTYYGLGCRNVSHILIPEDFDLDRFFGAIIDYGDVINHNKYANNYDYYKAIYLMNREEIIENGFLLTRQSEDLFAPIAVIHYQRYKDDRKVEEYIRENKEKIQVVVGKEHLPFGKAQSPALNDYADGVDTMAFLTSL